MRRDRMIRGRPLPRIAPSREAPSTCGRGVSPDALASFAHVGAYTPPTNLQTKHSARGGPELLALTRLEHPPAETASLITHFMEQPA